MIRNLQIEWMKIRNYRVFQVFSALYLIGILLMVFIFYKIYISFIANVQNAVTGGDSEGSDIFRIFTPTTIWRTVCFWSGFLLYLPGMVIINLFINEVNFKTHRQNIIDGWKRETFIYTKISLIICISLVTTLMNLITTFIMCRITDTDFSLDGSYILLLSFLQSFIYLMFALMLAILFRRSGIAIIVFFVYGLLGEWLFLWLTYKISPALPHLMPLQVADSLIIFPLAENVDVYKSVPALKLLVPAALAYAALYVFLAVRKYKYDDL